MKDFSASVKPYTMKRILTFCLLLLLLYPVTGMAQKPAKSWPNTLLWRISGKGLKKPSYLFGTMHVQDKRVFNLGDSLYYYFERAEGFAMEVDFHEYMDSIMTGVFNQIQERTYANDTEEEFSTAVVDTAIITTDTLPAPPMIDTVATKVEITSISPPAKSLLKEYRRQRNDELKSLLLYGRMPTILDAYLFGMAQKQGKWLGAVEDVKDQLNLKDELGKDIDEKEEMQKPAALRVTSLSEMLSVYLEQNLNKIEELALNNQKTRTKTIVFNNRNLKMLHSIDSLSPQRSMFYAVGAAHLPGDSGLIRLLRQRGYTVTPVISTAKLAAEKYAAKLPSLNWHQVKEDGLYTIEMPGMPTPYSMYGELLKMNVYVDITTMNFFMTGHTIAQFNDKEIDQALKDMAKSMGGKTGTIKNVDRDSILGREAWVSNGDVVFRIQVLKKDKTAFFLLVGTSDTYRINQADADKYFSSFRNIATAGLKTPADWKVFSLPEKGVTVKLPATPKRNKLFEKKAEGTGWEFSVFDCNDQQAGLYYIFQVRDVARGRYLENDSVIFEEFRGNLLEDGGTELKNERSTQGGFPAFRLDVLSGKESIFYKTYSLIRNNRMYNLVVIGHESNRDQEGPEPYFNSLTLTDYNKKEWVMQQEDKGGFRSMAPQPFQLYEDKDEPDSMQVHYISYDPVEARSYEIFKNYFSPYFWITSDTAYLRKRADSYMRYDDTVLQSGFRQNGSLISFEQVVGNPSRSVLKKMRMMLSADTLYTLITFMKPEDADSSVYAQFFTSFRVNNETANSNLLKPKGAELLHALEGKDNNAFESAKSILDEVPFTSRDLPLLHEAMLQVYPDDSLYWGSTRSELLDVMDGLSDSSTVDFVRNNYNKLAERGSDQLALLNLLVQYKNSYSYGLLKELFLGQPPQHLTSRTSLSYHIKDSLLLTKMLYPEILGLLKNPDYWEDVSDYTVTLVDSSLLDPSVLMPYAADLRHISDTLFAGGTMDEEDAYNWSYHSLVSCLGYVKDKEALRRFESHNDIMLNETAVYALVKMGEKPVPAVLEKLASNNDYRKSLYDQLKKLDKLSFFPAKYKSQRYFAEAALYLYATDDYSPDEMEYLGERVTLFNGVKKRFFLFRVRFGEDDKEATDYLGIAGPYELDKSKYDSEGEANELHDDEFDKKKIDEQFADLLKQGEEWARKNKKED